MTHSDSQTHNPAKSSLASARKTLTAEREGLLQLEESLGTDFEAAIQYIMETSGRLIVTGMGKSGHVAKKSPRL